MVSNTAHIPLLSFSSLDDYVNSFFTLKGRYRAKYAIDLFIFNGGFPFEEFQDIVVGRYRVDNYIMVYAHKKPIPLVDLSGIISFHQGMEDSGLLRDKISQNDFFYNFRFMKYDNFTDMFLIPTHIVL